MFYLNKTVPTLSFISPNFYFTSYFCVASVMFTGCYSSTLYLIQTLQSHSFLSNKQSRSQTHSKPTTIHWHWNVINYTPGSLYTKSWNPILTYVYNCSEMTQHSLKSAHLRIIWARMEEKVRWCRNLHMMSGVVTTELWRIISSILPYTSFCEKGFLVNLSKCQKVWRIEYQSMEWFYIHQYVGL